MILAVDIRHLTTPNPSGIGYYTLRLIEELARLAPQDEFLLFATGTKRTLKNVPTFKHSNVQVVQVPIPNKVFKLLMKLPGGPTMEQFLPRKPDAWLFPDSNIIKTRIPYLITAHDLSFTIFKQFFTPSQLWRHRIAGTKKLFEGASRVLAVSESTKSDLWNIYNILPEKISVTPLGVRSIFNPHVSPADKSYLRQYDIAWPFFLTLSTLEPRKNIESVIEAYDTWRTTTECSKPPHLVIAGGVGWKTTDISQALINATHRDDIHLIGYVDHKHKAAIIRQAEAIFFPSFYEGFGLPALEAMACGTPVTTSFTGSMPEVVEDAAIMVDPYNVRDLEQAFSLLEEDELKLELSERGIAQAKKFTWRATAEATFKAIKTLFDRQNK